VTSGQTEWNRPRQWTGFNEMKIATWNVDQKTEGGNMYRCPDFNECKITNWKGRS